MAGTRNYQSIGEVLVSVKTEFPDITISKIRFLEAEGLIEPERTPSGYRKFYVDDVDRLKSILRMQRDEYLPLKVIKERLLKQDVDEAEESSLDEEGAPRRRPRPTSGREGRRRDEEIAEAPTGLQMSIEEMSAATGVERDRIKELESFGIVCSHGPDGAKYYDGDDYIILSIVKDFFRFGIEPRHLTMYKHFDEREAVVLRGARGAHAAPEEPGRASRGRADARRPVGHVAQVQAGAAPHEPAGPPAGAREPGVRRRRARRGSASRSPSRRRPRSSRSPRPAAPTPPPTPVPPQGLAVAVPLGPAHTPDDRRGAPAPSARRGAARRPRHRSGRCSRRHPTSAAPIASLTKIMTALLVLERRAPRRRRHGLARRRVHRATTTAPSSTLGLRAGERITVRDLLYALLLQSANDAAVALAIDVCGSASTRSWS